MCCDQRYVTDTDAATCCAAHSGGMHVQLCPPSSKRSSTCHQSIVVRRARHRADWLVADELVGEYLDWLDESLGPVIVRKSGIGRTDRLGVSTTFAAPSQFYVAWLGGEPIGCAGVRIIGSDAELTRMYVTPRARGVGVSDELARAAIAGVKEGGYAYLRLDTHRPTMPVAYDLYRRLGFEERRGNPDVDGAVAMVLPLGVQASVP